jgi:hypothetical protein
MCPSRVLAWRDVRLPGRNASPGLAHPAVFANVGGIRGYCVLERARGSSGIAAPYHGNRTVLARPPGSAEYLQTRHI